MATAVRGLFMACLVAQEDAAREQRKQQDEQGDQQGAGPGEGVPALVGRLRVLIDHDRQRGDRLGRADAPVEVAEPGKEIPYDPLATVKAFYSALAVADGETASALVVPEKRGKGPFKEASITAFFGSMAKPLTLTGIQALAQDSVRVSYEYKTNGGKQCRGRADVQTVYAFGKTLISRIKALDGC